MQGKPNYILVSYSGLVLSKEDAQMRLETDLVWAFWWKHYHLFAFRQQKKDIEIALLISICKYNAAAAKGEDRAEPTIHFLIGSNINIILCHEFDSS